MGFNWVPQWRTIGEKPATRGILLTYIMSFKYTKKTEVLCSLSGKLIGPPLGESLGRSNQRL